MQSLKVAIELKKKQVRPVKKAYKMRMMVFLLVFYILSRSRGIQVLELSSLESR